MCGYLRPHKWSCHLLVLLMVVATNSWADWRERPITVVDDSGKTIDAYCLAPLYVKYSVSPGHRQDVDRRYFLRHPVFIGKDDTYPKKIPYESLSSPELPIFNAAGRVVGLPEARGETLAPEIKLFLRPGYKPLLHKPPAWKDGPIYPLTLVMERGDSEEVVGFLLTINKSQERLREIFQVSVSSDGREIVDLYTDADREILRKCYFEEATSDTPIK